MLVSDKFDCAYGVVDVGLQGRNVNGAFKGTVETTCFQGLFKAAELRMKPGPAPTPVPFQIERYQWGVGIGCRTEAEAQQRNLVIALAAADARSLGSVGRFRTGFHPVESTFRPRTIADDRLPFYRITRWCLVHRAGCQCASRSVLQPAGRFVLPCRWPGRADIRGL